MIDTLSLLKKLIAYPSVTPHDHGCQEFIATILKDLGFIVESMRFGEVQNLWARLGKQAPLVVFAGHTDVVPPGPISQWLSDPFTASERADRLYGRGATDMKAGLAAMMVAAQNFIRAHPHVSGSLGFLITSDEEGPALDGTQKVLEALLARNEKIDYCVIGEPSSEHKLGDQIRVGRRGSLSAKLTILGKQGHIAYPHLAKNPIHLGMPALTELVNTCWDTQKNKDFPPTSFQISNIHAGTGATNVIAGSMEVLFNFRFSTSVQVDELKARVEKILEKHKLQFELVWSLGGQAFLTQQGRLLAATQAAIKEITGLDTLLSTGGGTSDGRFIAATGSEVIELGPVNASAHQVNEFVELADLEPLAKIYQGILEKLLLP